jgi:ribosomal protein S27E
MAPQIGSTPQHCPGFQQFKHLSSFSCKCPECGAENEIFSDEMDRPHNCDSCGKQIDFTKCTLEASGGESDPR